VESMIAASYGAICSYPFLQVTGPIVLVMGISTSNLTYPFHSANRTFQLLG